MQTADIRNPHFRETVENTFRADASLDADLFVRMLTSDATFRLGARPPVTGRDPVRAMLAQSFRAFRSVRHRLTEAYEFDDVLIYDASVQYDMADGRKIEADYVNVLKFAGALVRDYRVYIDLSVLGAGQS